MNQKYVRFYTISRSLFSLIVPPLFFLYNFFKLIVINNLHYTYQYLDSQNERIDKHIDFSVSLKGWLTGFFLGLIVFMGCSLACVHAWFF